MDGVKELMWGENAEEGVAIDQLINSSPSVTRSQAEVCTLVNNLGEAEQRSYH